MTASKRSRLEMHYEQMCAISDALCDEQHAAVDKLYEEKKAAVDRLDRWWEDKMYAIYKEQQIADVKIDNQNGERIDKIDALFNVFAEDAKLGVSFARGEVWPEDAESGQTGPK